MAQLEEEPVVTYKPVGAAWDMLRFMGSIPDWTTQAENWLWLSSYRRPELKLITSRMKLIITFQLYSDAYATLTFKMENIHFNFAMNKNSFFLGVLQPSPR